MSIYDIINDLSGFSDDRLRELVRSGNPAEKLLSAGELSQREKLRSEVSAKPQGNTTVLDRIAGQAQPPVSPPPLESQMPQQPQGIGAIAPRGFADGGRVSPPYVRRFNDVEGAYADPRGIGELVGRPHANGMHPSTIALAPEIAGQMGQSFAPTEPSAKRFGIGALRELATNVNPLASSLQAGLDRGLAVEQFETDPNFSAAENLKGIYGQSLGAAKEFYLGANDRLEDIASTVVGAPIDFLKDWFDVGDVEDDLPPEEIEILHPADAPNALGTGVQRTALEDATMNSNEADGSPYIAGGAPNSGGVKADMERGGYEEDLPEYMKEVKRTKEALEKASYNVAPGNKEKWMAIAMGAFTAAASGAPTFMGGMAELGKNVTGNLMSLNREERATALAAAKQAYDSAVQHAALLQEATQMNIDRWIEIEKLGLTKKDVAQMQADANEAYVRAASDYSTAGGITSPQKQQEGMRLYALDFAIPADGTLGSPAAQNFVNKTILEAGTALDGLLKEDSIAHDNGEISDSEYINRVQTKTNGYVARMLEEDPGTANIFTWYQRTMSNAAKADDPTKALPPWLSREARSVLEKIATGSTP